MRTLSKQQKVTLRSLAINGKQNIKGIQLKENMNYVTTHRSIKSLEKQKIVWMSERNTKRGPKGAQEYSITPFGIVEVFLRCDIEDQIDRVMVNWKKVSPKFIIYWKRFQDRNILDYIKQNLLSIYPNIVAPYSYNISNDDEQNEYRFNPKINIVYRNILDGILINSIFNLTENIFHEQIDVLMEIISEDPDYKEIWRRWFSIQKFKFSILEDLAIKFELS